ncbi:MAG: nicotinate (nicotinamide) nucleotide adenylyltransferase [Acidobacteria bacterium RIFCSPLOWO2_12_FULL_65_11]|nr:MAG: nicotinate (nicotinamide) nucleotide adenylyltransferase [Acidobacteria bacterium RIFCSPLOWO2_02_FULL_64_15]OFW29302.1 MAG: nicotinate (nicotinamide) nucleotide adenylyltransferase [Acidobacteria bacterium RIFCSPLOWO2_12_FULL_65_11]
MSLRRIGILGGTFDPIHQGHLDAGHAAEVSLRLTEMFVVTASVPPHRTPVASIYHRFAMVALAVAGREGWRASDLELGLGTPSFTTDTLQRFHQRGYAASELFFVIGADAFAEIESWKDYPAILDRAHFAVVSRARLGVGVLADRLPRLARRMVRPEHAAAVSVPGGPLIFLIDAPTADVSSTAIRQRRASGEPVTGLVPPIVEQHIERHGLYSLTEAGRRPEDRGPAAAAGRLHGKA